MCGCLQEYELLRIIDIRDVHRAAEVSVKHKSHVFVILTPRRTFTVQTKNQTEMQEWISAINQAKVQLEFTSSSDLDSYSGSNLQLNEQLSDGSKDAGAGAVASNPSLSSRLSRPGLGKLGSGIALARRHQPTSNKTLTDSTDASTTSSNKSRLKGKATSTSSTDNDNPSNANTKLNKKMKNIPAPLFLTPPPSKQLQETTEILNTPTASPRRCSNALLPPQRIEDLHLISTGAQAMLSNASNASTAPTAIPSPPPSVITTAAAKMDTRSDLAPGTAPSSPGYYSGGEEVLWTTTAVTGEHMSSGEDEIQEEDENDPCFLEAGRVASEANAPGSGLVSAVELGSKVVRQGYLLKLGNKYKVNAHIPHQKCATILFFFWLLISRLILLYYFLSFADVAQKVVCSARRQVDLLQKHQGNPCTTFYHRFFFSLVRTPFYSSPLFAGQKIGIPTTRHHPPLDRH